MAPSQVFRGPAAGLNGKPVRKDAFPIPALPPQR